jgi:hypothetical protein
MAPLAVAQPEMIETEPVSLDVVVMALLESLHFR